MKVVKIIVPLLILILFFVVACARSAPAPASKVQPAAQAPSQELIVEGKALFDKNCAACHGASGEGTSLGPKIAGHSVGAMKMQVRNPMGTMPAFPASKLSDSELDKVSIYINSMAPAAAPAMEWERAAPETIHHWMALLAIQNNDVADARHHIEQALTYIKEPKHMAGMQKTLELIAKGNFHDAEHKLEEMVGSESPSGITMQRFHLQLVGRAIEAKDLAEVKHHVEKFMAKATDKQKKIAKELLEKAEKGDFHEAEHELEELIKG